MANALENIRNAIWLLEHHEINRKQYEELIKQWCDAEPIRHGYWIDTGSGQECSKCHEIQYGYDNGRRYCQNCGAKMDGKK